MNDIKSTGKLWSEIRIIIIIKVWQDIGRSIINFATQFQCLIISVRIMFNWLKYFKTGRCRIMIGWSQISTLGCISVLCSQHRDEHYLTTRCLSLQNNVQHAQLNFLHISVKKIAYLFFKPVPIQYSYRENHTGKCTYVRPLSHSRKVKMC
jgi:hypothetical protein